MMTNVPELFTVTSVEPRLFWPRAVTCQLYDVLASSESKTTDVSFVPNTCNRSPVAVFTTVRSYCHKPGGNVMPGLLHANVGFRVFRMTRLCCAGASSLSHAWTG